MTAMVPEAPAMKKIHIPKKDIDDFFRVNSEMLNTQARELFNNMGAEDQRRVLNSGPLNIFREPMEMYKFRVSINKEKEKEIADSKGREFVPKEAAEYEVNDWIKANKSYIGEEGAKHLDMFGPADQWRIISEGPASENMDPAHVIQTRAKRSRELASTVSVMFARRREQANAVQSAEAKAAAKPLFRPELADTVQAFFNRVVGCEVPDTQRRTGGFGVQHVLEEDRSKLVGKVKGIEGVVEILKNKYDCLKGERYRVVGERGGPAGMWRLEGGKTIPKTHVKEGGWKWVLEEPEPEAKLAKPPPVATAPVQTFTPKEQKPPAKKAESEEESEEESSSEDERGNKPKRKVVVRKRRVKKKAGSEDAAADTKNAKKGKTKTTATRKRGQSDDSREAPKKLRAKSRAQDSDRDSREDSRGREARSQGRQLKGKSSKRGRPAQEDSRDEDSRMSEDSRRGRPAPRSKARR